MDKGGEMSEIYLAVWYDRHVGDEYAAFVKLEDAIAWCKKGEAEYDHEEFEVVETDGWDYHSDSSDDGPWFHVERISFSG